LEAPHPAAAGLHQQVTCPFATKRLCRLRHPDCRGRRTIGAFTPVFGSMVRELAILSLVKRKLSRLKESLI
jgi:hypothetical protein